MYILTYSISLVRYPSDKYMTQHLTGMSSSLEIFHQAPKIRKYRLTVTKLLIYNTTTVLPWKWFTITGQSGKKNLALPCKNYKWKINLILSPLRVTYTWLLHTVLPLNCNIQMWVCYGSLLWVLGQDTLLSTP